MPESTAYLSVVARVLLPQQLPLGVRVEDVLAVLPRPHVHAAVHVQRGERVEVMLRHAGHEHLGDVAELVVLQYVLLSARQNHVCRLQWIISRFSKLSLYDVLSFGWN